MFENLFRKSEEKVDSNERAKELTLVVLQLELGNTREDNAVLEKGEKIEANKELKDIYKEAEELLKSADLEPQSRIDLQKTVDNMKKDYKNLE